MTCETLGDTVFIRLSQKGNRRAHFAMIDADDFERVVRSKWYAHKAHGTMYAMATSLKCLPKHHKRLHAFVLKAEPGQIIDHINGDGLDNRKQNLRIVTAAQNAKNAKRPTIPGKTSRFKGVCWSRHDGIWLASITSDGVQHGLGRFSHEEDAARAYDEAAIRLHGEYARTNATMKLFEMADPYVPDCSTGPICSRRHRHKLTPHTFNSDNHSYQDKVNRRVREDLKAFEETGKLPSSYRFLVSP